MGEPSERFRDLAVNLNARLAFREDRAHALRMIAEELAAAYAAGRAEALQWQPIDTAPRDGTPVDLLVDGQQGRYRRADSRWSAHGFWATPDGYVEGPERPGRAVIGWWPVPTMMRLPEGA